MGGCILDSDLNEVYLFHQPSVIKLMAAAPEMARVLNDIVGSYMIDAPHIDARIEKARDALKKAGVLE